MSDIGCRTAKMAIDRPHTLHAAAGPWRQKTGRGWRAAWIERDESARYVDLTFKSKTFKKKKY